MKRVSVIVLILLIVVGCVQGVLGAVPVDVWRPPQPVPTQCRTLRFELALLDDSSSMNANGRFRLAREGATNYILSEAPDCSLAVVATFGVTADVVAGEFLVDPATRSHLAASVGGLKADQRYTNFDEAAKLIELLGYQLKSAYPESSVDLDVVVYSDLISAPSTGKSQFPLADYLASRLRASPLRIVARGGLGELRIRLPHDPVPSPPIVASRSSARRAAPLVPVAVGAAVLVFLLVAAVMLRLRSILSSPTGGALQALVTTESVEVPGQVVPRVLGRDCRVEAAVGVPLVFSTDTNSATYVAAVLPDAVNGELFRLLPLPHGLFRIESPHRHLTVNGQPIEPGVRHKLHARVPVQLRLGPRVFGIIGVFTQPGVPRRGEQVFLAKPLPY